MKKTEDINVSDTDKQAIDEAVKTFGECISEASDAIKRAAEVYADAVTKYGEAAVQAFGKRYPGVTQVTWDKFIRIAGGKIIPEVLFLSDRISNKFAKMSIAKQQKLLGGKKTVKIVDKEGKLEEVPLSRLKKTQEDILFDSKGEIRSLEEQLVLRKKKREQRSPAYEVCGNILIVNRACKIGKDELRKILEDMK